MQNLISFLRTNKLVRVLFVALIVLSFLGLWAHHHEADHGHDCSVCHAIQGLVLQIAGVFLFYWAVFVRPRRKLVSDSTSLLSLFHGAILSNRAPPTYA